MYIFLSASKIKYEIYETFWTSLRAYLVNLSKLCFLSTLILFKVSSKTLYLTSRYIFTYSLSICSRYVSQITLKLNISSLLSLFDNAICQMDDLCQSGACMFVEVYIFPFRQLKIPKDIFYYLFRGPDSKVSKVCQLYYSTDIYLSWCWNVPRQEFRLSLSLIFQSKFSIKCTFFHT